MNRRTRTFDWLPPLCGAITIALAVLVARAEEGEKAEKLVNSIASLINADQLDKALTAIRAAEAAASDEVPAAIFTLSKAHYRKEHFAESLKLLTEITDRHEKSPVASIAWLGKGEVYARLGDDKKMVECLERGIAAPPVETRLGIMDASDTRNWAFELLGRHYVKTRQWEEALDAYTAWKPESWCGTCYALMETVRKRAVLLCLAHAGEHAEAVEAAWPSLLLSNPEGANPWPSAGLVLIRLYEEAGQRNDLVGILDELSPPDDGADFERREAAHSIKEKRAAVVAEMRQALRLLQASDAARLDAFLAGASDGERLRFASLSRGVAAWLLIRDRSKSVAQIAVAVRRGRHDAAALSQVLAAIDSPHARNALVTAAVSAGARHRSEVLAIIRAHCSEPEEVIARVRKSVSLAEGDDSRLHVPDDGYFFAAWPKPKQGSLPKSIPAHLRDPGR